MEKVLELSKFDVYIAEVGDRDSGLKKEVIRLKSDIAFDETIIEELKQKGVKKYILNKEE